MKSIIYKYDVMVPLVYNRFENNVSEHDTEQRLGLKETVSTSFDVIFRSYDIPDVPDGYDFKDKVIITLVANSESADGVVAPSISCMINGLLCESKTDANVHAKILVGRICKELSLVFSEFNFNRHISQPRVEGDWSLAEWKEERYKPYRDALTKGKPGGIILVESNLAIQTSVYAVLTNLVPTERIAIDQWLLSKNDDLEFLINEYYSALGTEMPKSKFFHLFAMIEFCEVKYKEHNSANRLYSDEYVEQILDVLRKTKEVDVDKDALAEINKALRQRTDIGRAQKLVNILHWMGIDKFVRFGEEVLIDKDLTSELIDIRNKLFHGGKEKQDDDGRRYKNAVEQLLYINEQIIRFVRRQDAEDEEQSFTLMIEGQKKSS